MMHDEVDTLRKQGEDMQVLFRDRVMTCEQQIARFKTQIYILNQAFTIISEKICIDSHLNRAVSLQLMEKPTASGSLLQLDATQITLNPSQP
jgi:hypothetical protein